MEYDLPSVDVVIVNYNGLQYLDDCLTSLYETEYPSFRVILVDNGSTDKSVALVQEKYPQVRIVLNNDNFGFGKASAIGMKEGGSDFVALLNNDTVVDKGWLFPLVRTLLEDSSVASACSKLLFMDYPHVINGVGGGMNFVGYGYDVDIYENDDGRFDEKKDVFFPCAAACLLRKSAFNEIGGFDKKFFMYHEDVDLGWRFWLKGYRVKCVPDSRVYHAFGGTSLKISTMEFRNSLGLRHAMRSLIKNYEARTLLRTLSMFIALGVRTTVKKRSTEFMKCLLWNIRMLPDTLRERRRIQKQRKTSDRQLSPLIWQQIRLPVSYPDYEVLNRKSFEAKGNRRGFIEMSDSRYMNLGYGWHGSELFFGDGKTIYRWTKDEAVFFLWNKWGDGNLSIDTLAMSSLLKRPRKIKISLNREHIHEFILRSDEWERISIPYDGAIGPIEIKIKAEDIWIPDDHFKNGDTRRLGIGVRRAEFAPKTSCLAQADGASVIIPTYNRAETLLKTLKALEHQSLSKDMFEVILVDDGSTDSTEAVVRAFTGTTRLALRYFKQENRKQGAARNRGIAHARMPLLVFIGDDILPSPGFLEEHLSFHRQKNRNGNVAVIGYTKWPEGMKVTPFMKFIGGYGYQFGYSLIQGEGPLPFNFFYTSNISLMKTFLEELEYFFEEDFTAYGWEDIELGYRLENNGMVLYYNPRAIAYHDHSTDISAFCMRQVKTGKASRTFLGKHPELSWFLGSTPDLKKISLLSPVAVLMEKLINYIDTSFLITLPHLFYDMVLKVNYAKGAVTEGE
jgi:GT2 family glycosyltransferase